MKYYKNKICLSDYRQPFFSRVVACLALLLTWAIPGVFAQTFTLSPAPTSAAVTLPGGCFNLTPQAGGGCTGNKMGAIWASPKLDFTQPFEIAFTASFDMYASGGADGIAVVFGDNLTTATAPNEAAGKLGYYGTVVSAYMSNSFCIEFDSYNNGPGADDVIPDDHVAVNLNASHMAVVAGPNSINGPAGIKDGIAHPVKITWDPVPHILKVFWGTDCKLILQSNYDYRGVFTNPASVQWGITAATGGACSNQIVCGMTTTIPTTTEYDTACGGPIVLHAPAGHASYSWSDGTSGTSITVTSSGTYTVTAFDSCSVIKRIYDVTINPIPVINGTYTVCAGATTSLTATVPGGTWSSTNPVVGTVGSLSGIVTGLTAGTTTISYKVTATGCIGTVVVTVIAVPPLTGTLTLCKDGFTILSDLIPLGTWSSSSAVVGVTPYTANSGQVWGMSVGTSVVTYTAPSGCYTTATVTVNPIPVPIAGTLITCIGGTSTLTDASPGGTWSSSNTSVATIGSASGIVNALSVGTSVITYKFTATGCYATAVFTVTSAPSITGSSVVCVGSVDTLTAGMPGGTWSTTSTNVSLVDLSTTCKVGGVSAGTAVVTYTITATGCFATKIVTVLPLPAPTTGPTFVCVGSTITLSNPTPGGIWSSSNTAQATVTSAGVVTGIGTGSPTISVTDPVTGCTRLFSIAVIPGPDPISGNLKLCVGDTGTLYDTPTPGTWSSGNPSVATIGSATGLVTAIAAGTSVITYFPGFCGTYVIAVVTVNPNPSAITGIMAVCQGDAATLSSSPLGGTWSANPPGIVLISGGSGTYLGTGAGTALVTYTIATGCKAVTTVTVNPLPAAITGTPKVCTGGTTTLMDASTGGTWSSGSPLVSVAAGTGVVSGISGGIATITYKLPTGCMTTIDVTVYPTPTAITGTLTVCKGSTTALADGVPGGTWVSSAPAIATIDITTGLVTGVNAGTAIIDYSTGGGLCFVLAVVTVNPLPAPITGKDALCLGDTTTESDATLGGIWSSTPSGFINPATGLVTAVSAGTVTITYKLPTGCYITKTLTVNPLPDPISGPDSVCVGQSITLTDATPGGTWTSSTPAVATVGSNTGKVVGISGGTTTITYKIGTGCYVTKIIKVKPLPVAGPILCPDTLCLGTDTVIAGTPLGGDWSISDTYIADFTYAPFGGPVTLTGLHTGTATLSYTVSNDCGKTTATKVITVTGPPTIAPITGILGVCSGFTDTLHDAVPGGVWSSSSPGIASIDPTTGIVTGIASGSVYITYKITTACGVAQSTVNVLVNMEPYITSNFIVACQTLNNSKTGGTVVSGNSECIMVCDSTVVRYYANGVVGSTFHWYVAGGTVVADYGDSIDIYWSTVGLTGSITLQDSFAHCIDSAKACIKVIDKPHAEFWTMADHYCKNDNILFYDLSTGDPSSPIVYTYWNWGDGTGTATTGSAEHSYSVAGEYHVTLTVKNACNCTDSFTFKITIDEKPGPDIQCPAVACDSELVTYSTSAPCGTYIWSVNGGTIVSGAGTASIQVRWDNVDSTGFGSVSLSTPGCPICSDPTTIKVPVILSHPKIEGLKTICADAEYLYKLPLWPATDYRWGVLDSSGAITGCHTDHIASVLFHTPGIYVLHGWYQNRIKLCGGNVFDTITVLPATAIVGASKVCAEPAVIQTYSVSGGYTAEWRLKTYTGSLITSGSGISFSYSFGTPGTYLLTATGDFCADSLTITVIPLPVAVDSITGDTLVCMGRSYSYKAWNDIPGHIYSWQAIGGTVTPASGSSEVTVTWSGTGTKKLIARHVSRIAPYCEGPAAVFLPIEDAVKLHVTGDTTPCANAYRSYKCNFKRGEAYDWFILPDSVGSVVGGTHLDSIRVLWNNVTTITTANVVVKMNKCDNLHYDTLTVAVQPSLPVTISASAAPGCPKTPIVFTASAGGLSYIWNFGDGSPLVTTTGNTSPPHAFPQNTTTANLNYLVHVDVLPDVSVDCPIAGIGTYNMVIKPGPLAYCSAGNGGVICWPETPPAYATVTSNVGGLTYQWYDNGVAVTGATASIYAYSDTHRYHFTVVADNGCSDTSNSIYISPNCPEPGDCGDIHATHSNSCNTLTFNATDGTSIRWAVGTNTGVLPLGWTSGIVTANPITATYEQPGTYLFFVYGSLPGCDSADNHFTDTVGVVTKFRYMLRCAPGLLDSVFLADHTAHLPFYGIDSVQWFVDGGYIGTGLNAVTTLTAGTTHTINHIVYGTKPGGTYTCSDTRDITMPTRPVASYTFATAPICEHIPVDFTPTPGFSAYYWDFGDLSSSLLPITQRAFTWSPLTPGALQIFSVTLTVTDSIGCKADTTKEVNIYHNTLSGIMGVSTAICPSAIPYPVDYLEFSPGLPPYSYLWSVDTITTVPFKSIYHTGSYWVTVTDVHLCQFTPVEAEHINVMKVPSADIFGVQHYCIGDEVQLYGYEGDGVTYQWFRDGVLVGTDKELHDAGRPVGHYGYQLVVTVTDPATFAFCTDTSAVDSIRVYALPAPPAITGPVVVSCDNYHLQLTAVEPVSGTYNWSNGTATAVNDIYVGGPYRAWFTDLHGCTNTNEVNVPMAPDFYFGYFPSGCYDLCNEQLPLTLYGPPCVDFTSSSWLMGGTAVAGGGGEMVPYAIAGDGVYQWSINNGLCAKTSHEMRVNKVDCDKCQGDFTASLDCDSTNPASFTLHLSFSSPVSGTSYLIGTDLGPVVPFSGTAGAGTVTATLTYTTLSPSSLPDSVTVELLLTYPSGDKCFDKVRVAVPDCNWVEERGVNTHQATEVQAQLSTAMLVYPNPASGEVTVSYDYGGEGAAGRVLAIYDAMGRRMGYTIPKDAHGNWQFNTSQWTAGMYIVRMEGDGKALQVQRIVIVH